MNFARSARPQPGPGADVAGLSPASPGWARRRRRTWHLRRRLVPAAVITAVIALAAAACGGGGGGGSGASQPSASSDGTAPVTPKVGGTLTFAELSPPSGMDPIVESGSGSTGLIEATAVFDTLLRYNFQTGKYDPGTALSATPNADATVWTIKLRPGVTFSDGTPYDADAVVFGLDRWRTGAPGTPACAQLIACPSPTAISLAPWVKDVMAVDKTTVQVSLNQPWGSFPVILAAEPGLIPSPTALKKCDGTRPANQCAFNTAPVGAGPFEVTSFKPGEAITMQRNPHYWGGQVYLDGLRFIVSSDAGGLQTLDAIKTGQIQAAYLFQPDAVAAAHDAKLVGPTSINYVTPDLMLNVGVSKAATNSVTVRRAVAAAVNPKVVNQRAFSGKAQGTTELFPSSFRWSPGVQGQIYDLAKAKQLVAQAKAEGWNGRIRILGNTIPSQANIALAVGAMLENAGMTPVVDNGQDIGSAIATYFKGDFDIAVSGFAATDDDWSAMSISSLVSTAPSNRLGFKDPAFDSAFNKLLAARSDADKTAAWKSVVTELNQQVPFLSLGSEEAFVAGGVQVHGMQPQVRSSVYLDKAWMG